MIPRERPPGTVGAMHARRETHEENARPGGAIGGHRTRPVIGVLPARLLQERGEAPATRAERIVRRGLGRHVARGSLPQLAGAAARLSVRRLWLRSAISMASSRACS